MRPVNVVLAHRDALTATVLADSLRQQFRKVATVNTVAQAEAAIARLRAQFVIVDLELVTMRELRELCSRFPATAFASIHRLADEAMWLESLAVGAVDCCASSDLHGLIRACERYVPMSAAAAA
jgi:DNA-binding NarL/FixJ family response regulator